MRNHSTIIREAGVETVASLAGVSINTARSWVQRDSLPSEYWQAIIDASLCTADELIAAAAAKRAA